MKRTFKGFFFFKINYEFKVYFRISRAHKRSAVHKHDYIDCLILKV